MKITKGQIVAVTTGCYSDYSIHDHFRAERDFDASEEVARFKRDGDYLIQGNAALSGAPVMVSIGCWERFLAWVAREGLMSVVAADEVVELHIGEYNDLEVSQ